MTCAGSWVHNDLAVVGSCSTIQIVVSATEMFSIGHHGTLVVYVAAVRSDGWLWCKLYVTSRFADCTLFTCLFGIGCELVVMS